MYSYSKWISAERSWQKGYGHGHNDNRCGVDRGFVDRLHVLCDEERLFPQVGRGIKLVIP
ncbi:hypothetical protein D3C72_2535220 [compost metagenome]